MQSSVTGSFHSARCIHARPLASQVGKVRGNVHDLGRVSCWQQSWNLIAGVLSLSTMLLFLLRVETRGSAATANSAVSFCHPPLTAEGPSGIAVVRRGHADSDIVSVSFSRVLSRAHCPCDKVNDLCDQFPASCLECISLTSFWALRTLVREGHSLGHYQADCFCCHPDAPRGTCRGHLHRAR